MLLSRAIQEDLMRILSALVVVPSLFTLVAACSSAGPEQEPVSRNTSALEEDAPQHVHLQKGAKSKGGSTGGNLIDHGGNVLPASHVVTIWWGNQSNFPSDAKTEIAAMFEGMNGSSFLGIGTQYMRGASVSTSYVTSYTDTASPPGRSPSTSTIVNEACKVINANGGNPDTSALYLVYTSNFPGGHVNYCAWHSHGTCDGADIKVAYMPNTTGIAGCDPGNLYNCNSNSQGTRSLANVSSHEYMETLTDPDLSAWYDSSGSEIGDKCAWQFQSCVNLGSGNSWQLQMEWSNANNGCLQQ
jgi:hypothetical protein